MQHSLCTLCPAEHSRELNFAREATAFAWDGDPECILHEVQAASKLAHKPQTTGLATGTWHVVL